jgi:thioredoxin reductase (NADPH)
MVIIIGAGPIGLACGIELQKRNIPFLILERRSIADSIYHYPINMTFFSTSDRLELGGVPFISHGHKPTRHEALEYYRRIADHFKLPINLYEEVTQISGTKGNFVVNTTKSFYSAKAVVVATGFYGHPNLMNVPGEDLPKVKHYYDEPHPYARQKIAVIGAGNSAVDVALETYRVGAEVTLIVRGDKIKDSVKYWVKPDIENRIKDGSIKAYFNSTVHEITPYTITIHSPDGFLTLQNDFVLAMTGYTPNYDLLKKLQVPNDSDEFKTPIFDESTYESGTNGIFVAGVVCGGLRTGKWFIENAREHAVRVADALAKEN